MTLEVVEGIMSNCAEYFSTFSMTVLKIIYFYCGADLAPELILRTHKLVRCWPFLHAAAGSVPDSACSL